MPTQPRRTTTFAPTTRRTFGTTVTGSSRPNRTAFFSPFCRSLVSCDGIESSVCCSCVESLFVISTAVLVLDHFARDRKKCSLLSLITLSKVLVPIGGEKSSHRCRADDRTQNHCQLSPLQQPQHGVRQLVDRPLVSQSSLSTS